ncbi:hypothetical protein CY35_19G088600 [Sphagnum magellanicum]|nr:hypothetical protein CY35_19G088600 [Sphagnum magellanicum]
MEVMAGARRSVEEMQRRGEALENEIMLLPSVVLGDDARARLLKMVQAERKFVERLASCSSDRALMDSDAHLRSTNFGHFEGIVHVLQHSGLLVAGANAVMKSISIIRTPTATATGDSAVVATTVHVDIVCTLLGQPAWVVVLNSSPRNRSWYDDDDGKRKGLRSRIHGLQHAASSLNTVAARPSTLVLAVREDLDVKMRTQLQEEFQAVVLPSRGLSKPNHAVEVSSSMETGTECFIFSESEHEDWVYIHSLKTATHWTSYWIELKTPYHQNKMSPPDVLEMDKLAQSFSVPGGRYHAASGQGESDPLVGHSTTACVVEDSQTPPKSTLLPMLLESMRHLWGRSISSEEMQRHGNLVNLDTTALVALVSELTNGGARALIQMTSEEREKQFPSMAKFVVDQVNSSGKWRNLRKSAS